jgi:hypothetical protein
MFRNIPCTGWISIKFAHVLSGGLATPAVTLPPALLGQLQALANAAGLTLAPAGTPGAFDPNYPPPPRGRRPGEVRSLPL